jgi:hypothetical protein
VAIISATSWFGRLRALQKHYYISDGSIGFALTQVSDDPSELPALP